MVAKKPTRPNQRHRTRKDLLRAAVRLMGEGRSPSIDEIAEEAMVSRATVYRYFPGVDALLLEASLDIAVPDAASVFGDDESTDVVARVEQADAALHDMMIANEPALRRMMVHALQNSLRDEADREVPVRQNRRTALINAAVQPGKQQFTPGSFKTLKAALAILLGPDALVVCKDVLQLEDCEARKVKRWAIRALVEAARRPS